MAKMSTDIGQMLQGDWLVNDRFHAIIQGTEALMILISDYFRIDYLHVEGCSIQCRSTAWHFFRVVELNLDHEKSIPALLSLAKLV
jgi:hypothetical protein